MALVKHEFFYEPGGEGISIITTTTGAFQTSTRMELVPEDAQMMYEAINDIFSILVKKYQSKEDNDAEQNRDSLDR